MAPDKTKHAEQRKNTQNTKTQQAFRINYFCVAYKLANVT